MDGVQALQQWLPIGWLTVVDGAAAASTSGARAAVAGAIQASLMAITILLLWSTARGLGRLVGGGGHFATPKGGVSGLRWLAGATFVIAPWVRVYGILQGQGDDETWSNFGMFSGVLWVVLVASDHRSAAVRGDTHALTLSRGFAVFNRSRWAMPLGEALIDADGGRPIGSVRGGRRRVRLRSDVQRALNATLGEQEGRQWLQRWLLRHDLVLLAGTHATDAADDGGAPSQ